MHSSQEFAAVDLGSNSFHLLVARYGDGELQAVERIKEKVQLMAGFSHLGLADDAVERGEHALARFSQRLRSLDADRVAVVGTCALRSAANAGEFVARAKEILGVDVRVVSGETEATLIYLGVAHRTPSGSRPRFVVDIGGGSTEFARGSDAVPNWVASVDVGCVSLKERFFLGHPSFPVAFNNTREYVREIIAQRCAEAPPGEREYLGTSGTIESIQLVLMANGWSDRAITSSALDELCTRLCEQPVLAEGGLPGLTPERLDIFPSGVAILAGIFDALDIDQMQFVSASLQDGMLYERIGLAVDDDVRERTVRALGKRFTVDEQQVKRVTRTALTMFDQVAEVRVFDEDARFLLSAAAALHEVGVNVSAKHYHRHGAYILQNSDLRGFSTPHRRALSMLVRGHRRSFPALAFGTFEREYAEELRFLCVLLRLAVILERSRSDAASPNVKLIAIGGQLRLVLPDGWQESNALSARELAVERDQVAPLGIALSVE